jgi:hypothetical protein
MKLDRRRQTGNFLKSHNAEVNFSIKRGDGMIAGEIGTFGGHHG